jgi:hypothetical protein
VENCEQQTNNLVNRFRKDRNGHPRFINVLNLAEQIDLLVNTLGLGPEVTLQWEKIRTELHQIADFVIPRNNLLSPDKREVLCVAQNDTIK